MFSYYYFYVKEGKFKTYTKNIEKSSIKQKNITFFRKQGKPVQTIMEEMPAIYWALVMKKP